MRLKPASLIAGLLALLNVWAASAATVTWTNVNGGSWSTPANWSPNFVPGAFDTALITTPGTYTITVGASVNVYALTLGAATGQQTHTNYNQNFTATNSLISTNGVFGMNGGTYAGTIMTNRGTLYLASATVLAPITIGPSGLLNFNGGNMNFYGAITNNGTIQFSPTAGAFGIANNHGIYTASIYNQAGALLDIKNDSYLQSQGYGYESILNSGTIRKSAGTGITYISVVCTNTGTVDAQSGTIQFNSGGNLAGTYNTASNALIQFASGTFTETAPTTYTGTGLFRLNGATVTLNERIPRFLLLSGYVMLSPTFEGTGAIQDLQLNGALLVGTNVVTGTLGMDGGGLGVASPLTVSSTGVLNFNGANVSINSPLTNSGTINWSGYAITINNNNNPAYYTGGIYNRSGGLFNIQNDQPLTSGGYGNEIFINAGILRKTAGLVNTSINVPFTNTGTIDAQSGTISFGTTGNVGGTYNTAAGCVIQFSSGTFSETPPVTITGSGLCQLNSATLTLVDQIPGFLLAAGNVILSPTFQTNGMIHSLQLDGATLLGTNRVTGTLGLNGGSIASASPLTIATNATLNLDGANVGLYAPLTNFGTINMIYGGFSVANNASSYTGAIYNRPGALINVANDISIYSQQYGFEFFSNAGTLRKTAAFGTTSIGLPSANTGLIDVQNGKIQFSGGGTLGGTYNTATGTLLEFIGGNYAQSGNVLITGTGLSRQNGAAVTYTDRITNFVLLAGNVILSPTFQTNGTIHNFQLDGASLTGTNQVTGTLTMNGGAVASASPLTVAASGTINITGGVTIYAPLTNAGTINWRVGGLSIANNANAYTGVFYNQTGAVLDIQCDQSFSSQQYGFEMVVNAGTVRKTAGRGTTTLNAPFSNSGTLDMQSGVFQISGPYVQSGGTMNFGITSLGYYGQIYLPYHAPLTGTLSVNFDGGYFPNAGDTFPLVVYGSGTRTGIFSSLSLPTQAQWQTNYSATTFTLTVFSDSGPPLNLAPVSLAAGKFTLQASGAVGPSYILLASTNLTTWIPVVTNTPIASPFTLTDKNASLYPRRFYRVQVGP